MYIKYIYFFSIIFFYFIHLSSLISKPLKALLADNAIGIKFILHLYMNFEK